jgi:acetate kinase
VESTMGFTALDGLPMGTRPGQLDAGVILYLVDQKRLGSGELNELLYTKCGLKGLSGISNDVRELIASSDPRAKMALDYFAYRIALFTGLLAAAMRGLDGFVFTAGIGEHAPSIREAILRQMDWLGVELDREANAQGALRISTRGSKVGCYVIPTDEELMIARHTWRVVSAGAEKSVQELRA